MNTADSFHNLAFHTLALQNLAGSKQDFDPAGQPIGRLHGAG